MSMIEHRALAGVILAGGLSRRMGGGDKGLLPLGSRTMLEHVIARLAPQVGRIVISANGDPARFARFALPVAGDPVGGFIGPLAGILAGLRWAAGHAPEASHVLSVSSDAPFLPADLGARLAGALAGRDGVAIARSGSTLHPVIGLWPVGLAGDLEAALSRGERRVRAWAERHGAVPVDFAFLEVAGEAVDPFFNANSPAELDEARRLLAHLSP